jgi:hypothetical protein
LNTATEPVLLVQIPDDFKADAFGVSLRSLHGLRRQADAGRLAPVRIMPETYVPCTAVLLQLLKQPLFMSNYF